MPELPEVETVRQQLKPLIIGKKIQSVIIRYPGIIQMDVLLFESLLIHKVFNDIRRLGKYLIFDFDNISLVSHLRMEGKYYLRNSLKEMTKHDHIAFKIGEDLFLTYHDVRKFGTMELVEKSKLFELKSLSKLGPEANDEKINYDDIYVKIKGSDRPIKSILLDQTIISGLGNIYVDETLFLSSIHPETKGSSLSKNQVSKILINAKNVINQAIELGGTTIRTYHSTLGIDGRFQNKLNVHTKKDQACPICGELIIKIKVGGRGTYLCPHCQRKETS